MTVSSDTDRLDGARRAVASNPFWYHTIEVAPGVVTPGWFDLRPIVDVLPWPDVRGKRCLDVGTADGFLAFELERRGAAEVVATDVADHSLWDYPARIRDRGIEFWIAVAGEKKGEGFRIARDILGSRVRSLEVSAYDLGPSEVGEFDVVVCGSLLLHLWDPVRALESMRSVCTGTLLVTNQVGSSPLPASDLRGHDGPGAVVASQPTRQPADRRVRGLRHRARERDLRGSLRCRPHTAPRGSQGAHETACAPSSGRGRRRAAPRGPRNACG